MKNEPFMSMSSFVLQWNCIAPFLERTFTNEYIDTQIKTPILSITLILDKNGTDQV